MKALSFAGVTALLLVSIAAKGPADEPKEKEHAKVTVFDFGKVKMTGKAKKVKKVFKVYNNSSRELRIRSVCSPCNYTVPVWSKGWIKPGKHGLVLVIYYPEEQGPFQASMRINYYNEDMLQDENVARDILVRGTFDMVNLKK